MAILTREEYLQRLNNMIGDDTSDDSLSLIEDMTDTYDNLVNENTTNWKEKYENNDKEWREKYRKRFFSGKPEEDEIEEIEKPKVLTFEDLFK